MLKGKTVVLGLTGGVSVYKVAEVASRLTQAGINVNAVMTTAAAEFVQPMTFQVLTRRPVFGDVFDSWRSHGVGHIKLAEEADVVVIAPATANTIAKLANGIADNMLTCMVLAARVPIIIAPSMNDNMLLNPATQDNLALLKKRGFTIIEPAEGFLASGKKGLGRLPEPEKILGYIYRALGRDGDMAGRRLVITAGGTQEAIDPVRHVSNRSSGKMGFALAEAGRDRGAAVTLITAPASPSDPTGMDVIHVRSAAEMKAAVETAVAGADALVMAAAVADYQPKDQASQKIKKESGGLTIELTRTPDILAEVKGNFIRVGFAAESQDMLENAKNKLRAKGLDLICANDITASDAGFDVDTNRITLIDKNGEAEELPLLAKREVADRVLDRVVGLLA